MKINRPSNISICFIGGDLEVTLKQEQDLSDLKNSYIVEFLHRGHKQKSEYLSFSQVVNEFVVESKNEFLFFINPKVFPKPYQIEDLIEKLCSGFCWSSRINFGFWGTTKELFRNIGLLDERFIGGEYEDNDFLIRLREFGKAIYWEYKTEEYKYSQFFTLSGNRGLSQTAYLSKWLEEGDSIYTDDSFEEKKLPLCHRLERNYEVFNSWLDYNNSIYVNSSNFHSSAYSLIEPRKIIRVKFNKSIKYCDSIVRVSCGYEKDIFLEFDCQFSSKLHFILLNKAGQNLACWGKLVQSNHWHRDSLFEDSESELELKIFHDGDKIYHNKFLQIPFDLEIKIGLKIVDKTIKN
jgi:hypothetical protein